MSRKSWKYRAAALAMAAMLPALAACETAPATGATFFGAGMTPEQERRVAAEEHPKLVEQFGGEYENEDVRRYVSSLGNLLAQTSEMPDLDWTFTVLDSPVVNAFALPAGYVYVTRGLLVLGDNEAQLAGVLGHEIGHVTARHSAQRYGTSILAGVVGLATGVAVGQEASQAVGMLSQVALSSYSRSHEFEADMLGVRYTSRSGHDPDGMAQFLGKMQQESRLQAELRGDPEAADRFSLLQTHPRTVDRVREAREAAGVAPVQDPIIGRDVYLSKLDGVTVEDSAEQGFVRDRRFLHPELRFAFEVPDEFRLFNSSTQVLAMGPDNALIIFDAAGRDAQGDPLRYMTEQWASGTRLDATERLEIDGMRAATGRTRINTQQGPRDVRLVAIRFDDTTMYRFMFLTPPNLTARLSEPLRRTTHSFRRLSEQEAAALEPYRLTIHEVQPGETVADLAARTPYAELRERRFRVLNGLEPGEEVQAGQKVKLVTGG